MAVSIADARHGTFIIVGLQLAAGLLVALVGLILAGAHAGYSALLGGAINVVASLFLVLGLFGGGPARIPQAWLARFLVGEALKFGSTVLLFVVAIEVLKAAFLPLILAYIATYLAYWVGLAGISVRRAV